MTSCENLSHACAESDSYTIKKTHFLRLQTIGNVTKYLQLYNKRVIALISVTIVASSRPSISQLGIIFTDISAIILYYQTISFNKKKSTSKILNIVQKRISLCGL